ncbi:MAG TPA: TAXI family TRAP transporter solute-binding subunit [Reyranella sp.]|nr:TAXI family TRAP transporter solute-binding subunit [Reyranella sp.]
MLRRRKLLTSLPAVALIPSSVSAQQMKATLGTTSSGGGGFAIYSAALLDTLRSADPVFDLRAVATKGSSDNAALLKAGEIDFGMVTGEVAHELMADGDGKGSGVKIVSVMYSAPGLFAVLADSRYHTIDDLKGRRIVWNARETGVAVQARYVMEGLGLDMDKDFEPLYPEKFTEGPTLIMDGKAAALWGTGMRWPGFVEMANSPRGARFVAPSLAEIKRIRTKYPFMAELIVPGGMYRGQYDPITTIGTWTFILARPGLNDAVGRRMASALRKAERTGALNNNLLAQTTAKNTLSAIPGVDALQPGVAQYFRDQGLLK